MKVILINGSPHSDGSTNRALVEVARELNKEGIETEIVQVGHLAIRGCIACGSCYQTGKCVFEDVVNEVAKKFEEEKGYKANTLIDYGKMYPTCGYSNEIIYMYVAKDIIKTKDI